MKIIVDCTTLSKGGGVQVAIALLVNLRAQSSVQWTAIVPEQIIRLQAPFLGDDKRVIPVEKRGLVDLLRIRLKLKAIERLVLPDVVFTVFGPPYFKAVAPHVVGFALPRLIYDYDEKSFSGAIRIGLKNFLFRWILRRADHLVVETTTVKERLIERLGISGCHISVIGNSINPLLLRSQPEDLSPSQLKVILVPSAYYPHKNLEIIPRIAAAMKEIAPECSFEFRLTLPADEYTKLLKDFNNLGIERNMFNLGPLSLSRLAEEYLVTNYVFLPTLLEASSAVFPESFYFRRPLITSDLDFARELCGDAALYVDSRDAVSTAKSILALFDSPAVVATMVEAGTRQLLITYPTAARKFAMQIELLDYVRLGLVGR